MGAAFIRLEALFFLWAVDDWSLLPLDHWPALGSLGGCIRFFVRGFSDGLFGIGGCGKCHECCCDKCSFHDGILIEQ